MVADVLTKALAKERHQTLRRRMGLKGFDGLQSGSVKDNRNEDIRNVDKEIIDKDCKQSKR